MPLIAEGSYKAAYKDSQQVYAFERQLDGERLLVVNNFYAQEVTLELEPVYQNGQVLLSNYESDGLGKTITLKPYQTLAILTKG